MKRLVLSEIPSGHKVTINMTGKGYGQGAVTVLVMINPAIDPPMMELLHSAYGRVEGPPVRVLGSRKDTFKPGVIVEGGNIVISYSGKESDLPGYCNDWRVGIHRSR